MNLDYLSPAVVEWRRYWVAEIAQIGDHFGQDSARVQQEVTEETNETGTEGLCDHLRLCGVIPESYGHDSTEEKLYSKYTDILLSLAFRAIGMTSLVLTERADAADVEAVSQSFSLVADAKAFRLSRTAKNQKDFKIQAMDTWKRGKPFAIVVCPLYQLPSRNSQIYQQAATRNVCILSYAHLCVLTRLASTRSQDEALSRLHVVLRSVDDMTPSKDAVAYWTTVNRSMLADGDVIRGLWAEEKRGANDALIIAKEEALQVIARKRERIMRMSHTDAISELIIASRLAGREETIRRIVDNGLFEVGQ